MKNCVDRLIRRLSLEANTQGEYAEQTGGTGRVCRIGFLDVLFI